MLQINSTIHQPLLHPAIHFGLHLQQKTIIELWKYNFFHLNFSSSMGPTIIPSIPFFSHIEVKRTVTMCTLKSSSTIIKHNKQNIHVFHEFIHTTPESI